LDCKESILEPTPGRQTVSADRGGDSHSRPCAFASSRLCVKTQRIVPAGSFFALDVSGRVNYFGGMSKAKDSENAKAGTADLPFEEAIKRLESIVESMEAQDLPLETLLARYEEGTRLAQLCQTKLSEAELKVQQLEKNTKGELSLKTLNTSQEPV
jgi:exodeoxyribonuclease VII small subunit